MYIALLGRQPELSVAELERLYGDVSWVSSHAALFSPSSSFDIQRLGGTQKAGRVVAQIPGSDWRKITDTIVKHYLAAWPERTGKITLGLSAYDFPVSPREVQKIGLTLKGKLKQSGVSLRLIPNQEIALSTATSHHNKLGLADNKVELFIIKGSKITIIAESVGAQNISALAARDQGRPRRDAFVGMLPPKLAQMMINFAGLDSAAAPRILDPFCGTGVLLQEAALLGYSVYGTDLSEKMVRYSRDNLNWLEEHMRMEKKIDWYLHEGDAMTTTWQSPVDAVVAETYLGQPFSAPPSPAKLTEVRGNCNHIISSFLTNLAPQLASGTPVVLAVPAWRAKDGTLTHLPLTEDVSKLGFERIELKTVDTHALIYFRPDQVVARELLLLRKRV